MVFAADLDAGRAVGHRRHRRTMDQVLAADGDVHAKLLHSAVLVDGSDTLGNDPVDPFDRDAA